MDPDKLQRQLSDLRSGDLRKRDRVMKELYQNPTLFASVQGWLSQYGAQGKSMPEDIIQEGMMRLYRKVRDDEFAEQSSLSTFLHGICRNLIRNLGRKVSPDRLDDESNFHHLPSDDSPLDELPEENQAALSLRNRLLREILAKLSDNCRSAITMQFWEDKKPKEIALAKGLKNPKQAKKLTFRCRKQLRELINQQPKLRAYFKDYL